MLVASVHRHEEGVAADGVEEGCAERVGVRAGVGGQCAAQRWVGPQDAPVEAGRDQVRGDEGRAEAGGEQGGRTWEDGRRP